MAWERSFEGRVLKVRDKELKYQKLNYTIEVRCTFAPIYRTSDTCEHRRYGMLSGTILWFPQP